MTVKEFHRLFIAVHKCVACDELLPWQRVEEAFCEKCQHEWNADTLKGCSKCFLPARECECMPQSLKKVGALTNRKLIFYDNSGENQASNGLIYRLKHHYNTRIARFVARELIPALRDELESIGATDGEVIITHVPRGRKAKMLYGFDQSERVCKQMSKLTKIPYVSVFRSAMSSKQQKDLDSKARMIHANATIIMRKKINVKEKYVVLFDDIVTTGASMSVCTRQLMKKGAKGVLCLCLASRPKSDRK